MRYLLLVPSVLLAACDGGKGAIDDTSTSTVGNDSAGDDTGAARDGAISVTPDHIDLDTIFVGQSTSADLTVTNVGTGEVSVTLGITGGWATSYTLSAYTSAPAPGASSTHTLTLTPIAWGDHSVSVLVDDALSGGHVEIPVTAHVQEDADQDGHGSAESGGDDCDDTDAAIHPGATDAWYDGIDSDCAGNDDSDQDADGVDAADHGGTDCADTDASIHPGQIDTWYDGVDSDCAGNDDYDQDADGYVPTADAGLATAGVPGTGALPGNDCDDTDPAINPGETDAWYDGVDSDCAGNDDSDQDADGYAVDVDCDDTDAAIHPDAADTWYDGIDSDCAGNDDYDQDGDGVDSPTDCNDTDATITGPTAESIDGIDNDCNGLVDDFAIDSLASGVLYGSVSQMGLGNHGIMAMDADLTGDGGADLVLGAGGSDGYAFVIAGTDAATANGLVDAYDTATVTGDSSYYPIGWVNGPFADVDGDGHDDLVVGGHTTSGYYSGYYGRSYLLDGGAGLAGSVSSTSYSARFSGDSETDDASQAATADLDGDGYADIVIGSAYDNYGSSYYSMTYDCGSVAIFSGVNAGGAMDLGDADDRVYGSDTDDYLGSSLVLADVDGDGYADIVSGAPGYDASATDSGGVFVIAGGATLGWDTSVTDAAQLEIDGTSRDLALGEDTLAHPGDVDGDGALDLGLTSENKGEAWIFLGAGALTGTHDLGDADYTFAGTAGDLGSMLILDSDLDGDGADEIVLGADGDDTGASNAGAAFVFSWSAGWSAALTTADARVTIWGIHSNAYFGSGGVGGADLDGDGRDDIAIGETNTDVGASSGGAAWIVRGW